MNFGLADGWVRPAEREFVRRVQDWIDQTQSTHNWYKTDFLTPREQQLVTSCCRPAGVEVAWFGGYADAERQRALLMPENWYPVAEDFGVNILCIEPVGAVVSLAHGQVLGAVLSTGIDRRKLGDIAPLGEVVYIFAAAEMAPYLLQTLTHVHRSPVSVRLATAAPAIPQPTYEYAQISVPSLRLDALVAAACRCSRATAQTQIERGHVTLNFLEDPGKDEEVAVGDIMSVRGYGRIRVTAVEGVTKKQRLRVAVQVLKSHR